MDSEGVWRMSGADLKRDSKDEMKMYVAERWEH